MLLPPKWKSKILTRTGIKKSGMIRPHVCTLIFPVLWKQCSPVRSSTNPGSLALGWDAPRMCMCCMWPSHKVMRAPALTRSIIFWEKNCAAAARAHTFQFSFVICITCRIQSCIGISITYIYVSTFGPTLEWRKMIWHNTLRIPVALPRRLNPRASPITCDYMHGLTGGNSQPFMYVWDEKRPPIASSPSFSHQPWSGKNNSTLAAPWIWTDIPRAPHPTSLQLLTGMNEQCSSPHLNQVCMAYIKRIVDPCTCM